MLRREVDLLISPAQVHEDADGVAGRIGDDDVGPAVAVQVGHGERIGLAPTEKTSCGIEGAVPLADQDADGVVVVVGDDQVGDAVAGQVGDGDGARAVADGEAVLHAEGAVAVPRRTLTVFDSELAVTISGRPSPFRSAIATAVGAVPTDMVSPGAKLPSPLPRWTVTVF